MAEPEPEPEAPRPPSCPATPPATPLPSYTVTALRDPKHGLGLTLDADGENNAFVDALVDRPGGPGAAEAAGIRLGSVVASVAGVRTLGLGVRAVGDAVAAAVGACR
jgi:hypothetical protein